MPDKIIYDCDTSSYWVSPADYDNRDKTFGRFIDDGAAYEITDNNTPRPWLNYLCNDSIASCVSNTASGFVFYRMGLLRITRYDHIIDYLPRSFKNGREIFLVDSESGREWNVFAESENTRCVHRPGYSTITARVDGIEVELVVYVCLKDPAECWTVRIRNRSGRGRNFTVRFEQVWTFSKFGFHTADDGIPYLTTPGKDLAVRAESNALWAHCTDSEMPFELSGVFLSPQAKGAECIDMCETRKDGREFTFKLCRLTASADLEADGEARFDVLNAADQSADTVESLGKKYNSPETFDAEFEALTARQRELADSPSCQIPDKNLQNFLNYWFKNQMSLTFRFIGCGYTGYRDTLQGTWGYTLVDPPAARVRLTRALAHMAEDGSCPRQFSPVGDDHDMRKFMDSATWIPRTLADYIRETGELSLMDEPVAYLNSDLEESVGEHVWRALDLLFSNLGAHGLCLTGDGDWNDALEGISKCGDAESAWLTMALFDAQNTMADLYDRSGCGDRGEILRQRSAQLKDSLNSSAWDGDWFMYGFTGTGKPIGSKSNTEGRIHLNAQTWAIMTGLADEEQTSKIRAAVQEHLQTTLGPALLSPPYVKEAAEVGRIAKLEPGTFENGSVYQHAVTFKVMADFISGHASEGLEAMLNILPTNPDNFDCRRTSEPYTTGNYYCGPGHPRFGQNFFTWFTSTPAWLLRVGFDYLLGVRADYDGLVISPNVPDDWDNFSVRRNFRGTVYDIEFQRTSAEHRGIWTDGERIEGNKITPSDKPNVEVKVKF